MSDYREISVKINEAISIEVDKQVKRFIQTIHGWSTREIVEKLEARCVQIQSELDEQKWCNQKLRHEIETQSKTIAVLSRRGEAKPQNDFSETLRPMHSCL